MPNIVEIALIQSVCQTKKLILVLKNINTKLPDKLKEKEFQRILIMLILKMMVFN